MGVMVTQPRINIPRYTLDQFFAGVVEAYGSSTSLATVGETPITYAEFGQKVAGLRQELWGLGLRPKDKVVLLGSGSPNWGIAFMAITTMGAIAVPIMDEFPEVDIEHIIRHSEATAIFVSDALYQSMNLPSLDRLQIIFRLDDFSLLAGEPPQRTFWRPLHERQERKKKEQATAELEALTIEEDDLAEILYTSGTTGHSKGVMLTHKNLVTNLIEGAEMVGIVDENSVVLMILPMAHSFGLTCIFLAAIYCGATIHFLDKKPSPKVLLAAMQAVRPTLLGAVPLIFEKIYHRQVLPTINKNMALRLLCKVPAGKKLLYKISGKKVMAALGGRLECAVIGGASLNYEVENFMREAGIPYIVGYGLSECSPLVAACPIEKVKVGAVGHAIPGVSIKIVDPDPDTGIGEIYVKGPNVMRGYYKNQEETQKVFTPDGWLVTGDRGYLDEDGFLFIKGRSKNVIVGPSGENIYPEVIEEKLKESQFVEEALVYWLDNQLVARVYPNYSYIQSLNQDKPEQTLAADIEKILETVRIETNTRLPASSRVQKIIEQRTPFIKTPTRKIKRAEYVPGYLKSAEEA